MTETVNLATAIDAAHEQPYNVPGHVLRRVYFLVGDEQVLFVDASMTPGPNNGDGFTGEIFVLTETRIVFTQYKDSVILGDKDFSSVGSTASTRMWPRNRLRGVALRGLEDGLNPDSAWHHDYDELWPPGAQLELHYEDEGSVTLPLSDKQKKDVRRTLRASLLAILNDMS